MQEEVHRKHLSMT